MKKYYDEIKKQAHDLEVERFFNSLPAKFASCSGSGSEHSHHYGTGGLIKHTAEVIRIGLTVNEILEPENRVDKRQYFLAALYHDVGKCWDYEKVEASDLLSHDKKIGVWENTEHKKLIHHITRSVLLWNEKAIIEMENDDFMECYPWLNQIYIDDITHAILAHHGAKEYGSPVLPQTRLAWLLHLCDGISARMDDCLRRQKV